MIPSPSKKSFGYPLPADALPYFCHPSRPGFTAPVRHPDGFIYAASGYLAIRCRRGHWLDSDFDEASPYFVERVARLPWGSFEFYATKGQWRTLFAADLFRFGAETLWHGPRTHTDDKPVVICGAPCFPLAILQLLSRLPKIEVCVSGCTVSQPVLFRFAGGEGVLPCHWPHPNDHAAPVMNLLRPSHSPLPGGFA